MCRSDRTTYALVNRECHAGEIRNLPCLSDRQAISVSVRHVSVAEKIRFWLFKAVLTNLFDISRLGAAVGARNEDLERFRLDWS